MRRLSEKNTISGFPVSPGSEKHYSWVRLENIVSYDFVLSHEHLCQKLLKSICVCRSYSETN